MSTKGFEPARDITMGDMAAYLVHNEGFSLRVWYEGGRFTVVLVSPDMRVRETCSTSSLTGALEGIMCGEALR